MFDPRHFIKKRGKKPNRVSIPDKIDRVWVSIWEEHCTECAVPLCYNQCSVYKQRADGKCSRIHGGIIRNFEYSGLLNYGLECSFEKWGKIETRYYPFSCRQWIYRLIASLNYYLYLFLQGIDFYFHLNREKSQLRKYRIFRNDLFLNKRNDFLPDAFIIECNLTNKESIQLIIQIDDNIKEQVLISRILRITKGINRILIPFEQIRFDHSIAPKDYATRMRVFVAPINEDTITNVVFTYLNFVKWKDLSTGSFVKCIAWDLDNTLWNGVFSEIGEKVTINETALAAIKLFDSRGIINTVVSKNDNFIIQPFLEKIGVYDYFVLPTINWKQKSDNLKIIAASLNLSLDSLAFVDDDCHELNEVKYNCPGVRLFNADSISWLEALPEFNPPTSVFSNKRREHYKTELLRQESYNNSDKSFSEYIKALRINCRIVPISTNCTDEYKRSFELLSRSNQYNLRTRRYSLQEYRMLISNPTIDCFAVYAEDRYGDYGVVCFFSLSFERQICHILDLVFSCRISRKGVEVEIVKSIQHYAHFKGASCLHALLIRTPKNMPLEKIFNSLPFSKEDGGEQIDYYIYYPTEIITENLAKVSLPY